MKKYFIISAILFFYSLNGCFASIVDSNHYAPGSFQFYNPLRILITPKYNQFTGIKLKMCCDNSIGACNNTYALTPQLCYGTLTGGCTKIIEYFKIDNYITYPTPPTGWIDCRNASTTADYTEVTFTFPLHNPFNYDLSTTTPLIINFVGNTYSYYTRVAVDATRTGSTTIGQTYYTGYRGVAWFDLFTTNEQLIYATSTYATTTINGGSSTPNMTTSTSTRSTSTDIGLVASFNDGVYTYYQVPFLLYFFIFTVLFFSIITVVLYIKLKKK